MDNKLINNKKMKIIFNKFRTTIFNKILNKFIVNMNLVQNQKIMDIKEYQVLFQKINKILKLKNLFKNN